MQPPDAWVVAPLESKELLGVCLRRLKTSLAKVRMVDAAFVWTEPHSRRVKVRLTIQQEVCEPQAGARPYVSFRLWAVLCCNNSWSSSTLCTLKCVMSVVVQKQRTFGERAYKCDNAAIIEKRCSIWSS
jgi:nonsense-mediated mRNA decay protein 3